MRCVKLRVSGKKKASSVHLVDSLEDKFTWCGRDVLGRRSAILLSSVDCQECLAIHKTVKKR